MRGCCWSGLLLLLLGCGATSRNGGGSSGAAAGGSGGGASVLVGRYPNEVLPAALPTGPSCTYGVEPVELQPMCGAASCGNGKVDSCMTIGGGACETSPGCMLVETFEACDGSDLSGSTCTGLGYSG